MTKILTEPYAYKLTYPTKKGDYIIYTKAINNRITLKTKSGNGKFVFEESDPRMVEVIAKLMLEAVKMCRNQRRKK